MMLILYHAEQWQSDKDMNTARKELQVLLVLEDDKEGNEKTNICPLTSHHTSM